MTCNYAETPKTACTNAATHWLRLSLHDSAAQVERYYCDEHRKVTAEAFAHFSKERFDIEYASYYPAIKLPDLQFEDEYEVIG